MKPAIEILRDASRCSGLADIPTTLAKVTPVGGAAELIKAFGYMHRASGEADLRRWAQTIPYGQLIRTYDAAIALAGAQ